jgi:hypothetical protein
LREHAVGARAAPPTALALVVTSLLAAWHVDRALRAGPLWRDEAHVVNWASLPSLADVWSNRDLDAFPAAWPMLVHAWMAFAGGSDASLRALGALIGIATLGALWWTARQLGARAPLFALVLYAANPCVMVYGGSVRGYGLALLALILFFGAVGCVVARPGWKTIAGAQLAALFAAHTDFRNCVYVFAALVGAAAVASRRRRWREAALVLAVGAIAAITLLPYVSSYRTISEWAVIWKHDWGYAVLFAKFADALLGAGVWVARFWVSALAHAVWGVVLVFAFAACMRELLSRRGVDTTAEDRSLFLLVTIAIAVPGYFALLDSLQVVTQVWYYQSLIALLALSTDGALSLRSEVSRFEAGAKLALAAAGLALAAPVAWERRATRMTNVDEIAARLEREAMPADLVLVTQYLISASFDRYYRGQTPWITLPEVRNHRFQDSRSVKEKMSRPDPIRSELDRIAVTLRDGHRVWVIGALWLPRSGKAPPDPPPAPAPETGWSEGPYMSAWSAQAAAVFAREARAVRRVIAPSGGPVIPFEDMELFVAHPQGSRTPSAHEP